MVFASKDDFVRDASNMLEELRHFYQDNGQKFIMVEYEEAGNRKSGLLTQCAGGVSVMLLLNAFQNDLQFDDLQHSEYNKMLLKLLEDVLEWIKKSGYDNSPNGLQEQLKPVFAPKEDNSQFYSTDAVSWVLALMIQYRLAFKNGILTDNDKKLSKKVNETILDCTGKIIKSAVILDGQVCGWGYVNDCTKQVLYYTYAVLEAINDFMLYVVGEDETIGITPDTDIIKLVGSDNVEELRRLRRQTVESLYAKSKVFLEENGLIDHDINKVEECIDNYTSLYNNLFLLDCLLIGYPRGNEEEMAKYSFSNQEFTNSIEYGVYYMRKMLDRSYATGSEWWDSPISEYVYQWDYKAHRSPNSFRSMRTATEQAGFVSEKGYVALHVRINILFAYYVSTNREKRAEDLFGFLLKNRQKDSFLWDDQKREIFITERSIEAFIDYYDYFMRYMAGNEREEGVVPLPPPGGTPPASIDELIEKKFDMLLEKKLSGINLVSSRPNTLPKLGVLNDWLDEIFGDDFSQLDLILLQDKSVPDLIYKRGLMERLGTLYRYAMFYSIMENTPDIADKKQQLNELKGKLDEYYEGLNDIFKNPNYKGAHIATVLRKCIENAQK